MEETLKKGGYVMASAANEGAQPITGLLLAHIFAEAAQREGFRLYPGIVWDGAGVTEIFTCADAPVEKVQKAMAVAGDEAECTVFLCADIDGDGRPVMEYPMAEAAQFVRNHAVLKSKV